MNYRMKKTLESGWPIFIVITVFTVIRFFISTRFGLGVDEAHYVLYGKFLALSYYDHPPLVGWVEGIFFNIFGLSNLAARAPAVVLYVLYSYLVFKLLKKIGANYFENFMGILAINTSFLLFVLSFMLLPIGFLLGLSILVIFTVKQLENKNSIWNYALLGVVLGISGLSEYTAILFILPLIIYAFIKKRLDIIFNWKILITIVIGIVLIMPVIYWNATHSFISLEYQFNHVIKHHNSIRDFLRSMAYQFFAYSPFYFILAIYGLIKSFKSKNDYIILSALIGGFIFFFFVYASITSTTLPHWDSVFYMLMIPIGIVFALKSRSKFMRLYAISSIVVTLIVTLFVLSVLAFHYIRFPNGKSPFRDIYGFNIVMKQANKILNKNPNPYKAIAVEHWTFGSRAMYYNLKEHFKSHVYVVQKKMDQFVFWEKKPVETLKGYDLLFIIFSYERKPLKRYVYCGRYKPVKRLNIVMNKGLVYSVNYEWCDDFNGYKKK